MSLLYPLGLLGLIAIPVLIIIYILKNKYVEQVIPATYLWTLSEKFLKRRNPIRRITGLISLILQILAVILISVIIAHPVFTLANAAEDYCFIIDGSGSMNIVQNDETRFDLAKRQIRNLIRGSANGSAYTLIVAGDSADVVYRNLDNKEQALELLDGLTPSYCAAGFVNALSEAQAMFSENGALAVYVVTDKSFEEKENVTVVNVAENFNSDNYALSDVNYSFSGGKLVVTGNAWSYENSAQLDVSLYIDGSAQAESTQKVEVEKLVGTAFTFESDSLNFGSLRVAIAQSDALSADNESFLYNVRYDRTFNTLIVSDTPFFMRAAFTALGNANIDVVSPDKYNEEGGYGLYIYDSFTPASLPRSGAVWFVNPVGNVANSGFTMQSEYSFEGSARLEYNNSTSPRIRSLLSGLSRDDDIFLSSYVQCSTYRSFLKLLTIDSGNPAVMAGTNSYGNREVVFAFDLHNSDFPLSSNFIALINNLISYTFPPVIDGSSYYCGDTVSVNVLPDCNSIRVDTPDGNIVYLDDSSDVSEYLLEEAGIYTITQTAGNTERRVNLYSAVPVSERFTTVNEQSIIISGEISDDRRDGIYDDLLIFIIILAVILIADWMVYCYEQYQLR